MEDIWLTYDYTHFMNIDEETYEKYKNDPEELEKREKYLAKDAKYAYYYARDVLKRAIFTG